MCVDDADERFDRRIKPAFIPTMVICKLLKTLGNKLHSLSYE
jgi:hypothetical protein